MILKQLEKDYKLNKNDLFIARNPFTFFTSTC